MDYMGQHGAPYQAVQRRLEESEAALFLGVYGLDSRTGLVAFRLLRRG
jgi:hypothetical protein